LVSVLSQPVVQLDDLEHVGGADAFLFGQEPHHGVSTEENLEYLPWLQRFSRLEDLER
jgi:hypothetical protein